MAEIRADLATLNPFLDICVQFANAADADLLLLSLALLRGENRRAFADWAPTAWLRAVLECRYGRQHVLEDGDSGTELVESYREGCSDLRQTQEEQELHGLIGQYSR